jgi:hypothetical protein
MTADDILFAPLIPALLVLAAIIWLAEASDRREAIRRGRA